MQFTIGDQVVHPVYGVGTVKTLSAQRFGAGEVRQYYEVATGDATVWVPLDGQGLSALREIAPKHSLNKCRRLLRSDPASLDNNPKLRQLEIAERLKDGLLPALCELVRDLRARSLRAPLAANDERVLRRIYKTLCDEWAVAEGVSFQAALNEVEDLLQESCESQLLDGGNRANRSGWTI